MKQESVSNNSHFNVENSFEKILNSSGCIQERETLQECYYEKRDWRLCSEELKRFRQCWTLRNNNHKIIENSSLNQSN
ncbi:uncharacterized protein T551_01101 [Pneumocystis jirovecii RU7]|uniref:CHCH domain-containing protein n=1 Tax=Pneumocystis jirovecii (strain RU7) TaxID=1408657 RepID=A0A0W4ZU29_PNEJ7|nr:uncharacterized protein T551_01101 [Pneumocystis jirovecii RU7]KTW31840.1 hypothetical protein T551_01101 [Pneumocystis jirovecii RU7]